MSPVLPLTAPPFIHRRRHVRHPAVAFLPFCPVTPDPKPEAGIPQEDAGWCKGSPENPSADCPPATAPDSPCATGGHSSPRRSIACSRNQAQVHGKAGIFFASREIDIEQM